SELVTLRWDQVDLDGGGILHITRRKRGTPSTHPISGEELRALRRLKREAKPNPFVFVSERGAPFSVAGFQKLIARAGVAAGFEFQLHPHMLRHSCGFKLANDGVDRHPLAAGLPRTQEYPAHRALCRIIAEPLQGLLEGLELMKKLFLTSIAILTI